MKRLWLYLHFQCLQMDSLYSGEANQHPLVIINTQKNTVVQLNAKAQQQGIRKGMGLGTAAALDKHLQVIEYQAEIELDRLKEIAQWLYLVTSDISFMPPDGLLLRVHNMLMLYGDLPAYWQQIQQQLAPLKLHYQYATAHSPLAAKMLATMGWDQICDEYERINQQLSGCPLKATELDKKTIDKLSRVGLHSIDDLLHVPLADIAKRFDISLVTYLGKLRGELQHPVEFYHPLPQFKRYLELLYELTSTQLLQSPLNKLLLSLEQFLRLHDKICHDISLVLHQRDASPVTLTIHSAQGEYQACEWLRLSSLQLESIKLNSPVFALTLSATKAMLRCPEKRDLFAGKQGNLSPLQLLSVLQVKLGKEHIHSPSLIDDYRPEIANQYQQPLTATHLPKLISPVRPSLLFNAPLPLTIHVSVIHGPERICSGWWDNNAITRDYFIARCPQGRWCWIYRTPSQQWFLHGYFS